MGRQRAPSLQRQQTSTLRSRRKNGPGMFWKMECQERRCPHGESNSAQISGAPWSNLCVLCMLHRRRSQDNNRRNCGLNFCPEPIWVQAVRETGRMMRHILGSLLLAASVLLLAGYKGADHEQTSGSSTMSSQPAVAADDHSQLVRRGREIFDETPRCAPSYTGANISCGDCHINSGTEPYAAPMVGLAGQFPIYSKRAGRVISLKERIQECFLRSENGRPLPPDSPEMQALVAYINWLSRTEVKGKPYKGRGLVKLAPLTGNATKGKQAYASECAGCHGEDGAGFPPVMPPVWGLKSYNDGAGINRPETMAAFLFHNMPQNHPGTLTAQQSFDIAAFIHTMPRPKFNEAYKGY